VKTRDERQLAQKTTADSSRRHGQHQSRILAIASSINCGRNHCQGLGPSCFALADGGSINGITIRRYVNDLEADKVAATKFAVEDIADPKVSF